jgi:nucleoside-diphosphate-sugar epimerase
MSKTIAITGANGMMGAHLTANALLKQCTVKAIVRQLPEKDDFFHRLLAHYGCNNNLLELIVCDYEDRQALSSALENCDEVYHCAAKVKFDGKINEMIAANVSISKRVVNICIEQKIAKVVYLSSIAAIGQKYKGKYSWGDLHWNGLYGYTKFLGELEFIRAHEEGLDAEIYRAGVIVGPCPKEHPLGRMLQKTVFGKMPYTSGGSGFVSAKILAEKMLSGFNPSVYEPSTIVSKNLSYQSIATTLGKLRGLQTIFIAKSTLRFLQILSALAKFLFLNGQRLRSHTIHSLTSGSDYSCLSEPDDVESALEGSIKFLGSGKE